MVLRLGPIGIIIALAVVLALLAGGSYGALQLTARDAFCASCHAYEKTSWDHGDHAETGCLDCHSKGFAYDKLQGLRKMWLTFTGQVNPHNDPLPSYPQETSANCADCHMADSIDDEQPFFVARHERYMQFADTCMACHDTGHDRRLQGMR